VIEAGVYVALITMLQHNAARKGYRGGYSRNALLTSDETNALPKSLQKTRIRKSSKYFNSAEDVDFILRLNAAGRRYLSKTDLPSPKASGC
jgi:hypothetical protein